MRVPPVVPGIAAVALFVAALPLTGAFTASDFPAAGRATSGATVLAISVGSHEVRAGNVALTSDTMGSAISKVVVTPLTVDGTPYGEQTVTPASSPMSVPTFDSAAVAPTVLNGIASVQSPSFDVSSSTASGAHSKAAAASLGSVSVLGLPVALGGTVDLSSVVDATNAVGTKTLSVKNLALPSVADILGALGLDLKAVPVKTLTDLLAGLNLTDPAVKAAQDALTAASAALQGQITDAQAKVDAAQAQLADAQKKLVDDTAALSQAKVDLAAAQAAVIAAQGAVGAANAAQASAQQQYDAALAPVQAAASLLGMTVDQYVGLNAGLAAVQTYAAAKATLDAATAAAGKASTDLANAQTVAAAAQAAVSTLQAAVDAAQKLVDSLAATLKTLTDALNALLGQVGQQVNDLVAAVTALLDKTPLVSIDSFTIKTQALVSTAASGGQTATVTGGEIQGLHVLGTDVLSNVLGKTSVNLLDFTGAPLQLVMGEVNSLTSTLSSVLSSVPGLSIPAPKVTLLNKETSTDISGGFGLADNSLKALGVTLPAITLPASLALPGAAALPAFTGLPTAGGLSTKAVGDLVSQPISISLGTLSEHASFRPSTIAATPGTDNTTSTPDASNPSSTPGAPELPHTGASAGLMLLSVLLMGVAVVLRRRYAGTTQE